MQAAALGTKRSFQSIPSLSRASFTGPSICRFQRRFYFQSSSPIKKLAIKLAKPLPVVRLQKLTPLKKIDRCFKIKAIIPDNKVVNDIIEAPVWQKVSAVLGLGAIASLNPFTTLYISQYAGKTTPMDVWRQILWGAKAAKKGRPASEERIVNALLRVSNAGSPGELFNAVLMALLLFLLAYWWKQGELKDVEPVKIDPPPPTPPEPTDDSGANSFHVGITAKAEFDDPAALRDLVIDVLKVLGMTEQEAESLIAGKVIYGPGAEVYKAICTLIFIECLECGNMVAIEHAGFFDADLLP